LQKNAVLRSCKICRTLKFGLAAANERDRTSLLGTSKGVDQNTAAPSSARVPFVSASRHLVGRRDLAEQLTQAFLDGYNRMLRRQAHFRP
jgi:hypothetical protein